MKRFFVAIAVLLSVTSFVFAQSGEISIIPQPASVVVGNGSFTINPSTKLYAPSKESRKFAEILNGFLERNYLIKLATTKKPQATNVIAFEKLQPPAIQAGAVYSVDVSSERINISGDDRGPGQFYALQTLFQLLPQTEQDPLVVPAVVITDSPRFAYRGMHLDVSRHFEPVEFVKKYIDLMAQFKLNTFHWHLTDDQGWRIEIKKYPKLTEIGSKRPETVKERNLSPYIGDGIPVTGFYTQKDIKDVIKYAKDRYITVIPEIELPGHASAALAAYPQFGCKTDYQYKVQTTWGIFKETYCPTDATFKFLEDVLSETIKLFPDAPYIHIGGDEVLKDHWKESPFVQELMKKENLKDEHEVQSYFVRRIEKFINSKGKKIIGWDEILEGGVAPNATIMSWRGMKGGIEAAKAHHDVIMTPTDFVYFDYGQGDPAYEPLNIGSYVPLEKVYSFEPVPLELSPDEAKYILGGQANLWTEYIKTPDKVEYMVFPRMLALAEVVWSKKEDRNFAGFKRRLNALLPRLDKQNINYRIPEPGGLQNLITDSEKVSVELVPADGTRIYYTVDGSTPDENSSVYSKPVEISLNEGEVKTLKTIVVNAAGRKSFVYAAAIVRGKMREPDSSSGSKPGVTFDFFVPAADMSGEGERRKGESRSILLNQFAQNTDLKKPFAVTFDGYFKAPEDGLYEFQVDSTWDTTVVLGGNMIIDDIGTAERKLRSTVVPLKAGSHRISIRYNHRGGDSNFRFRWGIKGQGLRQAYGGEFVH
ncbi:MAG: family 20 glycosylhydrolase [Acidobacteriota bacterium]